MAGWLRLTPRRRPGQASLPDIASNTSSKFRSKVPVLSSPLPQWSRILMVHSIVKSMHLKHIYLQSNLRCRIVRRCRSRVDPLDHRWRCEMKSLPVALIADPNSGHVYSLPCATPTLRTAVSRQRSLDDLPAHRWLSRLALRVARTLRRRIIGPQADRSGSQPARGVSNSIGIVKVALRRRYTSSLWRC